MLVNIREIIGSDSALTPSSGELIYKVLEREISSKNPVKLDFSGIEIITSAFLNSAVGRLYSKYSSTQLNDLLFIINISNDDLQLLKKVIERAKEYFTDQKSFNERLDRNLE